ncbi:hypothetical protein G647_01541 [Cladophialophora carrionii CBS 160.54]|uniref:FMN hydroxy acid dehydrogenase domain-containing protein n=1 Tax=Cladophialophora carrionii CBS 160.54 TaxID=1279043 RepID=V9DRZ8_9EURO|nr:uncharacterized protein G647_01541 [Cladophialophora carrionii CBS 160.54]ETI29088.1 hypothetical protein G647_01541 [Cladophialophora carrionii CBS 160.54]
MHKLAHPDGELATSLAAASINVGICLSSYATTWLEEVVKDRSRTQQLLDRAEAAGYKALFPSVDVPVLGRRLNEFRNAFSLPPDLGFPNLLSTGHDEFADGASSQDYDASLEWAEIIPWLRRNTNMQSWLKGILNPANVQLAINHGVDGVVISNHGGRQLDGVPATLDCLRECAMVAKSVSRSQWMEASGVVRTSSKPSHSGHSTVS